MTKRETDVKHEPEQLRKMFIGGLDYSTTDEGLKEFYEKWGTVVDVVVMKNTKTRRSRGFGFITYSKASMVDDAMNNRPHKIDGRQVEPKRAVPRDLCSKNEANVRKLFIGGIGKAITKDDLEEYFGKYGTLTDCAIVVTKDTGEPRGFGFVEYEDVDSADKVILIRDHEIKGRRVEIKKAIARDEINKDNRRGGPNMRDSRGGDFRNGQGNFGWNNRGMNNGSPWNNQQGPPLGNWGDNNFGGWNGGGNRNTNNINPWSNPQGPPNWGENQGNFGNWNGPGPNCGMNNPNNNSWNNQGPPMGNWGGNQSWSNNSCWGNNPNGYPSGLNNTGMENSGGMNKMNGRMGGGLGNIGMGINNMDGGLGNGNGAGGMGGAANSINGGGSGTKYINPYGNMGFNNFGGPSGGGPMRGNYGSSNNRPTPYPTSGGKNDRRGGGGGHSKFHEEKSGGRREGNKSNRF